MKIAETFFGGQTEVRKKIATAIEGSRQKKGMTPEQLDEECGYGERNLPKCADFVKNPELVSGRVFSRASVILGLKLNTILPIQLSLEQLNTVIDQMKQEGARVTAACGGGDVSKIPMDKQAPVYMYLKLVQELDYPHFG